VNFTRHYYNRQLPDSAALTRGITYLLNMEGKTRYSPYFSVH